MYPKLAPVLIVSVGAIFVAVTVVGIRESIPNLPVSQLWLGIAFVMSCPYLLVAASVWNAGLSFFRLLLKRKLATIVLGIGALGVAIELSEVQQVMTSGRPIQVSGSAMVLTWLVIVQYIVATTMLVLTTDNR